MPNRNGDDPFGGETAIGPPPAARGRTSRDRAPEPASADTGDADAPYRTEIAPPAPVADGARTEIAPPAHLQAPRGTHAPAARGTGDGAPPAEKPPAPQKGDTTLTEGENVGHFELIRELGRGGMGQVFLARDTKLGRKVALKFLALQSPELTDRFLVEARATARCQHENIVVIYEADEWRGQPYMALEYLEGQPLSELIEERTVSPKRAIELMVPVVRALVRAHEFNIVHRDLKPDNILVTRDGIVKVLDFGIAKLFAEDDGGRRSVPENLGDLAPSQQTQAGGIVGTLPYMSPEQLGIDAIDHRTDLWAVGIIFWEMLTGGHPLDPVSPERLLHAAAMVDEPMPRIGDALPELPPGLEAIVDRCLQKRKADRFSSAAELLEALEQLSPGRYGRRLREDESPYPGLSAFQEGDADRFFGRDSDILQMAQRMRDQPLLGVVGPSGVGKSSFVRAGVVPALRAAGESWEVLITRPGRDPLAGLASLLQPLTSSSGNLLEAKISEHEALTRRLREEPGYMGTLLRSRARQKRGHILLFVDQFEELYTLVSDDEARRAYTACLAGVADDASTPLRVVVSMRSDFLDRAAEDRAFMDQLTRGLVFLPPMDREGMREALTQPLEMIGYQFEDESIVSDMLGALSDTEGRLPLLQFTAAKLWDARDPKRRLLTKESYAAIGGLAGALATHADECLAHLSPPQQKLVRAIFQRLVTSDGTRAIAEVDELRELASDPEEVQSILDFLVQSRLLVVQTRGEHEGPAVEIVHESLIQSWPTLRRWLDENAEDSVFLEQLRTAANQWEAKGRPVGLLWRGEAMEEARRFQRRFRGDLSERERSYLRAVLELGTRAARRRRRLVVGTFAFLVALVAAAAVALVWVRQAEQTAQDQRALAEVEAERARSAEAEASRALEKVEEQLETIRERERERDAARRRAEASEEKQAMTYEQLEEALARAEEARREAERAQREAEASQREAERSAAAERQAKERVEKLLAEKQAEIERLEEEKKRLSTELR